MDNDKIPKLSDLVKLWLKEEGLDTQVRVMVAKILPNVRYLDRTRNRPDGKSFWIGTIWNSLVDGSPYIIITDQVSPLERNERIYPQDPEFFEKLRAHIEKKLLEP